MGISVNDRMAQAARRLRDWRPSTPPLPDHLAPLVKPDDADWFARELAIAAAPPWWFWRGRHSAGGHPVMNRCWIATGVPEKVRP